MKAAAGSPCAFAVAPTVAPVAFSPSTSPVDAVGGFAVSSSMMVPEPRFTRTVALTALRSFSVKCLVVFWSSVFGMTETVTVAELVPGLIVTGEVTGPEQAAPAAFATLQEET